LQPSLFTGVPGPGTLATTAVHGSSRNWKLCNHRSSREFQVLELVQPPLFTGDPDPDNSRNNRCSREFQALELLQPPLSREFQVLELVKPPLFTEGPGTGTHATAAHGGSRPWNFCSKRCSREFQVMELVQPLVCSWGFQALELREQPLFMGRPGPGTSATTTVHRSYRCWNSRKHRCALEFQVLELVQTPLLTGVPEPEAHATTAVYETSRPRKS
jgi:hypothetical protein